MSVLFLGFSVHSPVSPEQSRPPDSKPSRSSPEPTATPAIIVTQPATRSSELSVSSACSRDEPAGSVTWSPSTATPFGLETPNVYVPAGRDTSHGAVQISENPVAITPTPLLPKAVAVPSRR